MKATLPRRSLPVLSCAGGCDREQTWHKHTVTWWQRGHELPKNAMLASLCLCSLSLPLRTLTFCLVNPLPASPEELFFLWYMSCLKFLWRKRVQNWLSHGSSYCHVILTVTKEGTISWIDKLDLKRKRQSYREQRGLDSQKVHEMGKSVIHIRLARSFKGNPWRFFRNKTLQLKKCRPGPGIETWNQSRPQSRLVGQSYGETEQSLKDENRCTVYAHRRCVVLLKPVLVFLELLGFLGPTPFKGGRSPIWANLKSLYALFLFLLKLSSKSVWSAFTASYLRIRHPINSLQVIGIVPSIPMTCDRGWSGMPTNSAALRKWRKMCKKPPEFNAIKCLAKKQLNKSG